MREDELELATEQAMESKPRVAFSAMLCPGTGNFNNSNYEFNIPENAPINQNCPDTHLDSNYVINAVVKQLRKPKNQ